MHDVDWDSILVEETNNEEGRNDVTSEQGLYFQLGLDNLDDGREDDSSGCRFGNINTCEMNWEQAFSVLIQCLMKIG
jgi:hypothetical protein